MKPEDFRSFRIKHHLQAFVACYPSGVQSRAFSTKQDRQKIDYLRSHIENPSDTLHHRDAIGDVFLRASDAYQRAIVEYRQLQESEKSGIRNDELRDKVHDSMLSALQHARNIGEYEILALFDRQQSESERFQTYRRITRLLDESSDMLNKLHRINGGPSYPEVKNIEAMQRQLRNTFVEEALLARRQAFEQRYPYATDQEKQKQFQQDRIDVLKQALLFRIKNINPRAEHVLDREDSGGGTISIDHLAFLAANNRTYNCTRVVPAALGSIFGGRVKAVPALDDKERDRDIRTEWTNAYEGNYGGRFRHLRDLDQLFDELENVPDGTMGVLFYSYKGQPTSHVTVAGKLCGVPCIVEAQVASVVVRDKESGKFIEHELSARRGKYHQSTSKFQDHQLEDVRFLPVEPSRDLTEYERAHNVTEALHRNLGRGGGWDSPQRVISSVRTIDGSGPEPRGL